MRKVYVTHVSNISIKIPLYNSNKNINKNVDGI